MSSSSELFALQGRVALVTGATGGLGRAIVEALAAHGAKVVASDLDADACRQAATQWRAAGLDVQDRAADVSDTGSLEGLTTGVRRDFPSLDILVHCAGVQGPAGPLCATTEADWARVMDINLRSALTLSKGLLPAMARSGGGSVVFLASIAGLRGNRAIGLYGLSKAALSQMARNLAVEWGPSGVRVNTIAPGLIRTPLSHGLMADPAFMERRMAMTPLRRVGDPVEVAGVAVMLASRAGAFITGQTLVVDGGTLVTDGS